MVHWYAKTHRALLFSGVGLGYSQDCGMGVRDIDTSGEKALTSKMVFVSSILNFHTFFLIILPTPPFKKFSIFAQIQL